MSWLARVFRRPPLQPLPAIAEATRAADEPLRAVRTLLSEKQAGPALDAARMLVGSYPADGACRLALAHALRLAGRHQEALSTCDEALALDSDPVAAHVELAECRRAVRDLSGALDAIQIALSFDENSGAAWTLLADLLIKQQKAPQALDAARRALEHLDTPTAIAVARFHEGQALLELMRPQEAAQAFTACLAINPQLAGAHVALGHARLLDEDEAGAIECYERALSMLEQPPQNLLLNLGIARMNVGDLSASRSLLERLHALAPGDHTARWYLCQLDLLECRWRSGWSNYPARFGAGSSPYRPMPFQPWKGQELGRNEPLLVLADQGLGDEIMYASCLPDLADRVETAIVECEPRLVNLFSRSFPYFRFVATQRQNDTRWLDGFPSPRYQVASGDLPGFFRNADEDFPPSPGFLLADEARVADWRRRLTHDLGSALKVGISWRGGVARTRTKARSLGASHWSPILGTPGIRFVNLQYGNYAAELAQMSALTESPIIDYPEAIRDYDETAALVCALDLVITVCTAIVHLSGALGRPVWILTPHAPGWRYTAHRTSMPWYPTSRIFRQARYGDWSTACREVSDELAKLTNYVSGINRDS